MFDLVLYCILLIYSNLFMAGTNMGAIPNCELTRVDCGQEAKKF